MHVIEVVTSLDHPSIEAINISRASPICVVEVDYARELSLADGVRDSHEGRIRQAGVFGAVREVEVRVASKGRDSAGEAWGADCSVFLEAGYDQCSVVVVMVMVGEGRWRGEGAGGGGQGTYM